MSAGGLPADHVAKWDGASWSAFGAGTSSRVSALVVHDDGGGPALYAGGSCTAAAGTNAERRSANRHGLSVPRLSAVRRT